MVKIHKHDTSLTEDPDMEQSSKQKKTINVKIQTLNPTPDKSLPIIGYFSSGYDPEDNHHHNKKRKTEHTVVKVMKHVKRNSNKMQVVVSCNTNDKVKFVGTNYLGEAAAQQVSSYSLGVLDKDTGVLKILPIQSDKIFRLEPRFDDEVNPADENSKDKEAEEEKDKEAEEKKAKTFQLFSTKKAEQTAKKEKALHANRDPDLNSKMADAKVNAQALEVGAATTSSARNIPPHDLSATTPQQAYPLENIIFKGEWKYLLDIHEILQKGNDIIPESYPVFVCNRTHKIDEAKDEKEKERLACIYSYINHLIKFNDKHSMGGFSSAKHHKLPNILTQKFNDMFAITESERLSDDKRGLLISYVLVLTLFVDNFKTEFSDIANDLKMTTGSLRPHFEYLGCKFTREHNITLATLPAPLKFREVRMKRRR